MVTNHIPQVLSLRDVIRDKYLVSVIDFMNALYLLWFTSSVNYDWIELFFVDFNCIMFSKLILLLLLLSLLVLLSWLMFDSLLAILIIFFIDDLNWSKTHHYHSNNSDLEEKFSS